MEHCLLSGSLFQFDSCPLYPSPSAIRLTIVACGVAWTSSFKMDLLEQEYAEDFSEKL